MKPLLFHSTISYFFLTEKTNDEQHKKDDVVLTEATNTYFGLYQNDDPTLMEKVWVRLNIDWVSHRLIYHAVQEVLSVVMAVKKNVEEKCGEQIFKIASGASREDLLDLIRRFVENRACSEQVLKHREHKK